MSRNYNPNSTEFPWTIETPERYSIHGLISKKDGRFETSS
jgi:hypothetical protein